MYSTVIGTKHVCEGLCIPKVQEHYYYLNYPGVLLSESHGTMTFVWCTTIGLYMMMNLKYHKTLSVIAIYDAIPMPYLNRLIASSKVANSSTMCASHSTTATLV